MEDFLLRFGLIAVFVGSAFEGDITMIVAGVVVHMRLLDFLPATGAGACGAFASDCVIYGIGRTQADAVKRTRTYRRVAPVIERLATRFGRREIIVTRFVYGTRIASMLLWGMWGLPFRRFAIMDLFGCTLWAITLVSLGYLFSNSVEALIGRVKKGEVWLLVAFVVVAAAMLVIKGVLRGRVRRSAAAERNRS